MAKEKNISFSEFFEGFKSNLKTSKSKESKLDTSKLSDDIVGVQNKISQHTKSMLTSMNSQIKAMVKIGDAFKAQSLVAAGSVQIPDASDGVLIESMAAFGNLYELVSGYFISRKNSSDEMVRLASEANKLASDANGLTKDKIRSDLLAEKEKEAEAAKKDAEKEDGKISNMLKSAVKGSGFFGKIVGLFAFLAGLIVGFVGEIYRKIKSLSIVKKVLGIFDPIVDFFIGIKTFLQSGTGSLLGKIKNLKLFKIVSSILKPVTFVFKTLGKAFGYIVKTFKNGFDFIKPVFSFFKELSGGGGGKLGKFFSSITKFFKIGLKVGSTLAKGIPIIGQIIMVIEGLIYGIIGAIAGFKEGGIIGAIKGFLSGAVKGIVGTLVNLIIDGVGFIAGLFGFDNFKKMLYDFDINKYIDMFFDILFDAGALIVDFIKDIPQYFVDIAKGIGEFFSDVFSGISKFFSDVFSGISKFFSDAFSGIGKFFSGVYAKIVSLKDNAISNFNNFIGGVLAFFDYFGDVLSSIGDFFSGIGENIFNLATKGVEMYKQYIMNLWGGFFNIFSIIFDKVGEMLSGIGESFSSGFGYLKELWQGYIDKITGVFTFIGDLVTKAADLFGSIGDKFMDQWDQISGKVSGFMSKLSSGIVDIASKAEELIKEALRMIIPDPGKNTSIKQPGYWALKAIPDAIIDYAYSKTPVPTAVVNPAQLEVSAKSGSDAQALNDAGTSWGSNIVSIVNNSGGNVSNTSNNSQVKNIGSAAAPVSSGSLSWSPQ